MKIKPLLDVPVGAAVTVKIRGHDGSTLEAELIGYFEGWPEVRFSDASTCIVRPSSIVWS